MNIPSVEFIQAMLAPGLMISACGLLLLGMNNKYSVVVARIRNLDQEVRGYRKISMGNKLSDFDTERMGNIILQNEKLIYRVKLIRNAVIFYSLAVAFFVTSSLLISYQLITGREIFSIILVCFLTGMLSVLAGAFFTVFEMIRAYSIILIEVESK